MNGIYILWYGFERNNMDFGIRFRDDLDPDFLMQFLEECVFF